MAIVKAITVLVVVGVLAYMIAAWSGAPQGTALTDAQTTLSTNPFDSLPPWPTFQEPSPPAGGAGCDAWDLPCQIAAGGASASAWLSAVQQYVAALGARVVIGLFAFLAWFFSSLGSVASVTWGLFTAPFALFTGDSFLIALILFLPLWAGVAIEFLRIIRGTSS